MSEFLAEQYSQKHDMAFFEVSPLCDFNVVESFAELSRLVLKRNGMNRLSSNSGSRSGGGVHTLQDLCMRELVTRVPIYGIDRLPLPLCVKEKLKSYSMTHKTQARMRQFFSATLRSPDKARKQILNPQSDTPQSLRRSCTIS